MYVALHVMIVIPCGFHSKQVVLDFYVSSNISVQSVIDRLLNYSAIENNHHLQKIYLS